MKTLGNDKRKSVGHRLAIIEGHLRKVRRMVDEGANCIDIVHQSQAIQSALKNFDEEMIRQHLTICVARDIKVGKGDTVTNELIDVYKRV